MEGLGVLGVGSGRGGLRLDSWMKVEATANSPSRRRCMEIARLTSLGCEERASLEAGGIGLSLNFCWDCQWMVGKRGQRSSMPCPELSHTC